MADVGVASSKYLIEDLGSFVFVESFEQMASFTVDLAELGSPQAEEWGN